MKASDTTTGSGFAVVGLAVIVLALHFPQTSGEVGPGFFPIIVGSILLLAGIAIAAGGALNHRAKKTAKRAMERAAEQAPEQALDQATDHAVTPALKRATNPTASWLRDRHALAALTSVPLAIVGWVVLAEVTGGMLASILIVALVAIAWGARIGTAIATGVIAGIVVHLFFGIAMRVPLPAGLLERLLQ